MSQEVVKSNRGGHREGAGRPPNTMPQRKAKSLRERYPVFPLDYMMSVLNAKPPEIEPPVKPKKKPKQSDKAFKEAMTNYRRELSDYRAMIAAHAVEKMDAAKAAAPYVHPRLAAFDINTSERPSKHQLDLSKLTTEELKFLERVVAKSQKVTVLENDELQDALTVEHDDSGYT